MTAWSLDHARKTYSIPHWAEGYFDVDAQGRIVRAAARRAGARRSRCRRSSTQAKAQGAKLPLLVRFPDILGDRLRKLQARVRAGDGRAGTTPAATPRSIRSRSTSTSASPATLAAHGGEGFGLEAGSKPELMAVLGAGAARQRDRSATATRIASTSASR